MSNKRQITQAPVANTGTVASGNSGNVVLTIDPDDMMCVLAVTVAESGIGTLDVYIQTSYDGGNTYVDFIHFPQVTTGTGVWTAAWSSQSSQLGSGEVIATGDAVLAAGRAIFGPINPTFCKVKWVVVAGTGSYNFSVRLIMNKWRFDSYNQTGPVGTT